MSSDFHCISLIIIINISDNGIWWLNSEYKSRIKIININQNQIIYYITFSLNLTRSVRGRATLSFDQKKNHTGGSRVKTNYRHQNDLIYKLIKNTIVRRNFKGVRARSRATPNPTARTYLFIALYEMLLRRQSGRNSWCDNDAEMFSRSKGR